MQGSDQARFEDPSTADDILVSYTRIPNQPYCRSNTQNQQQRPAYLVPPPSLAHTSGQTATRPATVPATALRPPPTTRLVPPPTHPRPALHPPPSAAPTTTFVQPAGGGVGGRAPMVGGAPAGVQAAAAPAAGDDDGSFFDSLGGQSSM